MRKNSTSHTRKYHSNCRVIKMLFILFLSRVKKRLFYIYHSAICFVCLANSHASRHLLLGSRFLYCFFFGYKTRYKSAFESYECMQLYFLLSRKFEWLESTVVLVSSRTGTQIEGTMVIQFKIRWNIPDTTPTLKRASTVFPHSQA